MSVSNIYTLLLTHYYPARHKLYLVELLGFFLYGMEVALDYSQSKRFDNSLGRDQGMNGAIN